MRTLLLIVICAFTAVAAQAQANSPNAAKPKIYISNSDAWQKSGGFKTRTPAGADNSTPDTTHLNQVSAMAAQCSITEVTTDPSKAAYILLWDTKAIWNAFDEKTNLLIMYTPKGDAVYSVKTDSMGSAAKHVCRYFDSIAAPKPAPKPAKTLRRSKLAGFLCSIGLPDWRLRRSVRTRFGRDANLTVEYQYGNRAYRAGHRRHAAR
jgi:hypothetical protein